MVNFETLEKEVKDAEMFLSFARQVEKILLQKNESVSRTSLLDACLEVRPVCRGEYWKLAECFGLDVSKIHKNDKKLAKTIIYSTDLLKQSAQEVHAEFKERGRRLEEYLASRDAKTST